MSLSETKLIETLRCSACRANLRWAGDEHSHLKCTGCGNEFPLVNGIPRMLLAPLREALLGNGTTSGLDERQVRTALSFGFEWQRFPEMYAEWNRSFLNAMQPHAADFFRGKKVLDAGCGNGRFSYYAAKYGADVWAIDVSAAVEVTRRNTDALGNVEVIQADLHHPPFALESFDFIYSIGVLHHLPDPEGAFQNLLRFLKPGGEIQICLYWKPEGQPIKQMLLRGVAAARQITTRLPHGTVHALAFPAALAAFSFFVWPYQLLKKIPACSRLAEKIPMKQYADFPFRVCVNDQLDRFSAPIENRYTREEVAGWLERAGLEETKISAAFGWVATGRKPFVSAGAR